MNLRNLLKTILAAGGQVIPGPPPRIIAPPQFKNLVAEHREALKALILKEGVPELSRVEREVYRSGAWLPPER